MKDSAATESQRSLHLHRVLEDEFISLYGPLPDGYPWSFLQFEIRDPPGLLITLYRTDNELSQYLREQLLKQFQSQAQSTDEERASDAQVLFDVCQAIKSKAKVPQYDFAQIRKRISDKTGKYLRAELAFLLNRQLANEKFYTAQRFSRIDLEESTKHLAESHWQGEKLSHVNRRLLEEAYPRELRPRLPQDELESVRESLLEEIVDESGLKQIQRSKAKRDNDLHVSTIHSIIYERDGKRSALCLSGGGIRSATFNLGILQGLARHDLIGEFDYLSTVSGGGYIGSWLSAWIHRHPRGVKGVTEELSGRPDSPLEPESREIRHLRTYSNYLSPQTGLLSADTWTLAAIYIRNLFLNWLVFIPLLLAVLMIPRIGVAAVLHSKPEWTWLEPLTLMLGIITALIGIGYAGYYLPRQDARQSNQSRFLTLCLLPLVVSCISLTFFWTLYQDGTPHWQGWSDIGAYLPDWFQWKEKSAPRFMVLTTGMIFIGWALYAYTRRNVITQYIEMSRAQGKDVRLNVFIRFVAAIIVVILAGLLTGYLLWWVATNPTFTYPAGASAWWSFTASPSEAGTESIKIQYAVLFACFAAPLLLIIFSLGTTLIVGFASRNISDEDLEWVARFAGWILIVVVFWCAINALVLYGPSLILLPWKEDISWSKMWASIITVTGIVSGAITILGGFSAKTPASGTEQDRPGMRKTFQHKLTKLAAPAFFCFLVIVLSTLTNWLLNHFSHWMYGHSQSWPLRGLPITYFQTIFPKLEYTSWHEHFWMIGNSPFSLVIAMTIVLAAFCYIMGRFIDTGKFSIHSLYGNRLKRAYLGASRKKRRPNWFTDFDPGDDTEMHNLRTALFSEKSFRNPESLINKLTNKFDPLSVEINKRLSPATQRLIERHDSTSSPSEELQQSLACDLNKMLDGECLYIEGRQTEPKGRTWRLLNQAHLGETRVLLNRWILEDAYPDEIRRSRAPRPLHVVNIALNLMKGNNLAWQERKAETFTVSPLHAGNHLLGYRRSRYYGGEEGVSLGTAFTISGAAASPNMGYMISSSLVSFLMAMFNVRLGWWLGNPGPHGDSTYNRSVPKFAIGPVVSEALSMTDDKSPYVYLSDGGHFDNLGLYEMVLRRCRLIVVSDASTDPKYKFDALGMAIRKIRIDLGVPVEFKDGDFQLHTRPPHKLGKYCAIGTIRYSCVDNTPPDDDGVLIFIKASMSGDEPQDVLHYQQENELFPQEFIGDQFFSESQFESYRMLGSHIMDAICGADKEPLDLTSFEERIRAYQKR
ncbi:MAG: hypothetical protein QOH25_3139 [Acidobacteriota bacterium]|jgi:hypothetical protein|nr:hypothetical protein [Acidobacteriota bacterium]